MDKGEQVFKNKQLFRPLSQDRTMFAFAKIPFSPVFGCLTEWGPDRVHRGLTLTLPGRETSLHINKRLQRKIHFWANSLQILLLLKWFPFFLNSPPLSPGAPLSLLPCCSPPAVITSTSPFLPFDLHRFTNEG